MDRLLNNVTEIYAELSVGVYRMLIQRCNQDGNASFTTGIRRATIMTHPISLIN